MKQRILLSVMALAVMFACSICNFEMESSGLAGMASLLGHKAMTCCIVVANRYNKEMNTDYQSAISKLVKIVLDRI